jgi:hypothetical protein
MTMNTEHNTRELSIDELESTDGGTAFRINFPFDPIPHVPFPTDPFPGPGRELM